MRASQSIYLTGDKSKAVAEGDPSARFLLVRAGNEIEQSTAEKYEGAIELIGGTKSAEPQADEPAIETRDPVIENRDPQIPSPTQPKAATRRRGK